MFLASLGGTHTLGRLFGNTSLGYVSSISEGKTDHNPPPKKKYTCSPSDFAGAMSVLGVICSESAYK